MYSEQSRTHFQEIRSESSFKGSAESHNNGGTSHGHVRSKADPVRRYQQTGESEIRVTNKARTLNEECNYDWSLL